MVNYLEKNLLQLNAGLEGMLKGKIAVVTGAGSGLGKAIALALPFAGAKVGVLDFNEQTTDEVVSKINSMHNNCAFKMVADVTDEKQLEKVYSKIKEKFGSVDILINCAGVAKLGGINSLTAKDIKFANDVNLNGYFFNAHFASKQMVEKKAGSIINISSASARGISSNSSLYGVAKEAQCMMARGWAFDLGPYGIRVNALLPGDLFGNPELGVDSNIWNQSYFEKKAVSKKLVKANDSRLGGKTLHPEIRDMVEDHYIQRTILKQRLSYKDIINTIIFLSSDLGAKITGESIAITTGNPYTFSK